MSCLRTGTLSPSLQAKISPFFHEILQTSTPLIHSIYLVGAVLSEDYQEQVTKIDSVIVLKQLDLAFLDTLAPLGKKYRQQGLAAPLIMDPGYLEGSLDVFPLEFLNFRLAHLALYGEDLFAGLEIDLRELRIQCERELKGKLIWLHRIYLSSMGDKRVLAADICRHFSGYLPIFRGILQLLGQTPPLGFKDVLDRLYALTGTETGVFEEIWTIANQRGEPSEEETTRLFAEFYRGTEKLTEVVDGIER